MAEDSYPPLHKIDKDGNLYVYWNGEYYQVADENNLLRLFNVNKKEEVKCHT